MDIKIVNEKYEFRVRTCGLICQDNKYLILKVGNTPYYHIPGGFIEIGEDSKSAVIREMKEEIGCEVEDTKLVITQETFWEVNNKKYHAIEFCYLVSPKGKLNTSDYTRTEIDKGTKKTLNFRWVTKEELKNVDLKPENIKNFIVENKINEQLIHNIIKSN